MSLANLKLLKAGKRRFTLLGRVRVIGLHYGPIDSISFNIWRLDGSVSNSMALGPFGYFVGSKLGLILIFLFGSLVLA